MTNDEHQWLQKIGAKLRQYRIASGHTSAESFSNEYGLARGYYWKIEAGKQNMTMLYFKKLCEIHATTIPEFLSEL